MDNPGYHLDLLGVSSLSDLSSIDKLWRAKYDSISASGLSESDKNESLILINEARDFVVQHATLCHEYLQSNSSSGFSDHDVNSGPNITYGSGSADEIVDSHPQLNYLRVEIDSLLDASPTTDYERISLLSKRVLTGADFFDDYVEKLRELEWKLSCANERVRELQDSPARKHEKIRETADGSFLDDYVEKLRELEWNLSCNNQLVLELQDSLARKNAEIRQINARFNDHKRKKAVEVKHLQDAIDVYKRIEKDRFGDLQDSLAKKNAEIREINARFNNYKREKAVEIKHLQDAIDVYTSLPKKSEDDCFIVTAVYDGDRTHPTVVSLRRWRDERLIFLPLGKQLISLYYFWGPPCAAIVSRCRFRYLLRRPLASIADSVRYPS